MNIDNVIILEQAFDDMTAGKIFYDANGINVGDYFFDSLLADIESLKLYAGIHGKHFGLYRMLAKRFPFAIYYDITETTVVVIAVLDSRRKPAWIRKKLTQPL